MSIYQGSRYEFSVIDFVAAEDGADANAVVFYEFDDLGTFEYEEHEVVSGERIDYLANYYYRRPDLWWLIMDYNPEIADPANLPVGSIIRIPRV
jgi:hypothetical protein